MKKSRISYKYIALFCMIAICMTFLTIYCNHNATTAHANDELNVDELINQFENFTESTNIEIDGTKENITGYESYINNTFRPGTKFEEKIYDEWIMKIVPSKLFEYELQDCFYMGKEYGFFFDYDKDTDTYFIYLMLHYFDDQTVSGHIVRKISPLYYEKYKYDRIENKVSLLFTEEEDADGELESDEDKKIFITYSKYSDKKNVYLKNVAFNGNLYNANNYNIGEDDYIAEADNGGYFIGGSYKFKGVSTQSGKTDFYYDMFKIALGIFGGDKIGMAMTIMDMLTVTANGLQDAESDFRKEITNENDYSFYVTDIERDKQIQKYNHLLKDYLSVLNTPDNNDGVLFGIKNDSYIQSTFYYNFANQDNKENTGFVGRIKMDIVEENGNIVGSTVSPIASNLESNDYKSNIYDKRKETIEEDKLIDIYNLVEGTCQLKFIAPENGLYTFESFGNIKNIFNSGKGVTEDKDGVNQKLIVELKKGEEFIFITQNISDKNGIYQIKVEFTPEEIVLGETKTLNIKAGETEYFAFYNEDGIGFNYSISKGSFMAAVMSGNRTNILNYISAENKTQSAISVGFKGKYLISINNFGDTDVDVEVAIMPALAISCGQADEISIGHKVLYQIDSLNATGIYNLGASSSSPMQLNLYDENFRLIKWQRRYERGCEWLFDWRKW